MTAPSQTPEAAGLEDAGHIVWWKAGGVSYYPKGEDFTVSASCRVEPLVTAASAQAAIDAEKARADRAESRIAELATLFGVCDGGRYLNDWKAALAAAPASPLPEGGGQLSKNLGELDPRLVEWGYTSLDEAIAHLGRLLDDQAAFDGLAAPTGDARNGKGEG